MCVADGRAPAAVILKSAAHRERIAIVSGNVVKLPQRKIDAEQPGGPAIIGDGDASVPANHHVIRAFRIDPQNMIFSVNLAEHLPKIPRAVVGNEHAAIRSHDVYAIYILWIDVDTAVIHGPWVQSGQVLPGFAGIETTKNSSIRRNRVRRLRAAAATSSAAGRRSGFRCGFSAFASPCRRWIGFHDRVDHAIIAAESRQANTPLVDARQTVL